MAWFGTGKATERNAKAAHGARRRARKAAAKSYGPIDRMAIWERHNGICHICKRPVPRENFHLEHKVALANGGSDTPDNLGPAHPKCNLKKGARSGPKRKGLRRTPLRRKPKPIEPAGEGEF